MSILILYKTMEYNFKQTLNVEVQKRTQMFQIIIIAV